MINTSRKLLNEQKDLQVKKQERPIGPNGKGSEEEDIQQIEEAINNLGLQKKMSK